MKTTVTFKQNDEGHLDVDIKTPNLTLQSITEDDLTHYYDLFSNKNNVDKYATGEPWDFAKTQDRFNTWLDRWHKNIPFSSLAVKKTKTGEFIGCTTLGYGEEVGSSELAYIFDHQYWGQGYGKEAASAVVEEYVPEIINQDYKIKGQEFTTIVATARCDNEPSIRILEKLKFDKKPEKTFKFGHERYEFFAHTNNIMGRYHAQKDLQFSVSEVETQLESPQISRKY